ncbi:MAG TPA: hypothetical protein EYM99_06670 [Alphaproteobacteria bacterium]|nr:hypothetical protein [Alphaproteobacteria bacterium]
MRHPLTIGMLVVWVLNDHLFKEMYGNALTGKLSDFAGMAVFPLIPVAAYELGCSYRKISPRFQRHVLLMSLGTTAILMAGVNLFEPWADALRIGLGAAQWPFRCVWWLATEGIVPPLVPVFHTADPTDLWSLVALGLPYWIVTRGGPHAPKK